MEVTPLIHKLHKYKNTIFNILIVIVALIISNIIYKSQSKTFEILKLNNEKELKKNKVLNNIKRLDEAFLNYKNAINKKDVSLLINNISSIARDSGLVIDLLKPLTESAESIYINYPFELRMHANSYHEVGRFMSRLESDPDIYIVDSMVINLDPESQKGRLLVTLKFRTIIIPD
jgi:Tfp pilus assembly protein PilO